MTSRSFRGGDFKPGRARDREFEPIVEGARYHLASDVALAIWAYAGRLSTAGHGDRDESGAQQRFHEVAARVAARGGRLRPDVGRVARVDIEIGGDLRTAGSTELEPRIPGRTTLVMAETRRLGSAAAMTREPVPASAQNHATTTRDKLPGASEVAWAMAALQLPSPQTTAARGSSDGRAPGLTPDPAALSWLLARDRGPQLYRRAEHGGEDVNDSALAAAIRLLDEVRGGDRLPIELMRRLGSELGTDLSSVRVHTGDRAAQTAASLGARAVAVGDDIYFAAGAYDPTSTAGIELIAHEVAHVAQHQRGVHVGERRVSQPDDAHERQADAFATQFVSVQRARQPSVVGEHSASHEPVSPRVAPGASPRHAIDRAPVADPKWEQLFQGGSVPVDKLGRVSAPLGIYLKAVPAPSANKVSQLVPFNDQVYVARTSPGNDVGMRWAYVVATAQGVSGFIEERFLAIDPPEPTATLHRVKPGETLGGIADVYGASFSGGNDARLYVQALYLANKGRPGIRLDEVHLSLSESILRNAAEQETLKIYRSVRVIEGQALWIPSEPFVQQLKASGAITSGSTELSKEWRTASAVMMGVVHGVEFVAGVLIGALEGLYEAVRDIFKGAWELIKIAFEVVKAAVTGHVLELLKDTANKVKEFFEHFSAGTLVRAVGKYIADRWNNAGWFGKGEFIGEVVGYIAANVILAILTEGGTLATMLAEAAEAGSDLARAVMMLVKVTDAAQNPLKLLKDAGKGVEISEAAAAKLKHGLAHEAETARNIEHGASDAGKATKGTRHDKPSMTAEARSLDGVEFSLEFMRDLSPAARGLVRKLEKQGWVRVEEIAKDDLIQISKWFNKEVAVVQSPYGRLRIVLGTENGILRESIKDGEVFVVHTHPVMRSHPDHFKLDLEKAGKNVEAVIDWNGNVTYYAKKGTEGTGKLMNPVGHDGFLQPMLEYEAGFIDKEGKIVGFAKVDLVDGPAGTTVKVVPR